VTVHEPSTKPNSASTKKNTANPYLPGGSAAPTSSSRESFSCRAAYRQRKPGAACPRPPQFTEVFPSALYTACPTASGAASGWLKETPSPTWPSLPLSLPTANHRDSGSPLPSGVWLVRSLPFVPLVPLVPPVPLAPFLPAGPWLLNEMRAG